MLVFQTDPVGVEPNYVKMFFCSNTGHVTENALYRIASCNGIQDSLGFWIPHSGVRIPGTGFQVLDSSLCQWNLDSGFQSLVGFRTPCTVFRILKPRIPNSTCTIFPDFGSRKKKFSGIRNPLHGANRRC